ncbi:GroES-like protein [Setomelanomma holmii]|uniref:GroES-like protein n=1 Tax=Setomelanomma holmii TaxID=210430 RepID=A0A9P4HB41_9PLEO|nr:GroES-like protein [Setomelanomma holmii]
MVAYPIETTAIVSHVPKDGNLAWTKEKVRLRQPLEDEILVRIVASGICHTDIVMSATPAGAPGFTPYPKITGHEGSGVVERVGNQISHVEEGDKVLLSFDYCGKDECRACASENPGYCLEFHSRNISGVPEVYQSEEGKAIGGLFFGQSSFAQLAIVKGTSAVNVTALVKDEEELKLFAPMGCGLQTGAGAVTELANIGPQDALAVFGLGGVGMAAIMAAKVRGAKTIIGVDRVKSRLDLAREMGATHVIDPSNLPSLTSDLVKAIRDIVPKGTNFNFDTTGVLPLIDAGVQSLHQMGQMILIGIVSGQLGVNLGTILAVDDFEKALHDMHAGSTIKPILLW